MSGDFRVELDITIRCQAPSPQAGTVHVGYRSDTLGLGSRRGTVLRIGRQVLAQYLSGMDWQGDLLYAENVVKHAFELCVIEDGAWSFDAMKLHLASKQATDSGIRPWDGRLITADAGALEPVAPWDVDLRERKP